MSFDSLSRIAGLIIIISMLIMGYSLERTVSLKKGKWIYVLAASIIFFFAGIKVFSSINDDLYISSNNSYKIKMCDLYYDNEVLMAKDRYKISIDGYDSSIKIWSYNTEKAKEFFNTYNNADHYYDYMEVSSQQKKVTISSIMTLLFKKCSLEDFVTQDINIVTNTGIADVTGNLRSVNRHNKTYYIIGDYLLCGQDVQERISKICDKGQVSLHITYDISKANGKEFFKYRITEEK